MRDLTEESFNEMDIGVEFISNHGIQYRKESPKTVKILKHRLPYCINSICHIDEMVEVSEFLHGRYNNPITFSIVGASDEP